MTRLREALKDIAEEAPLVHLADVAVKGHRRRRRATVALAAVSTVVVLGVATAGVSVVTASRDMVRDADALAPSAMSDTVSDLPAGAVGVLSHAYQTNCIIKKEERKADCGKVEWRVVTREGKTYRLAEALVRTKKNQGTPIALSRDGRMVAYYSREAQTYVVRDLVSGTEVTSPVKLKEERFGLAAMLVLSDDGRHLVFDPSEGTKDPGLVIDMKTGATLWVPGVYEPISVKGGVVELVRYVKTDLLLMPVTGGGQPVNFKGPYIFFSELAPDGRTVVAVKWTRDNRFDELSLLDVKSGQVKRKVPIKGLPKGAGYSSTELWRSASEIVITTLGKGGRRAYAIDVNTGRAQFVTDYKDGGKGNLVLPGTASQ
ncbi:hypothetical protein ACFOY2_29400 [Nonomuraea purpurea]|uniref:WD40 repeat domain-containing protein n=1 Tax=Nonomuraea purpurea TaxID=1849276 RepID=A0ABV8GFD5_9ACTN